MDPPVNLILFRFVQRHDSDQTVPTVGHEQCDAGEAVQLCSAISRLSYTVSVQLTTDEGQPHFALGLGELVYPSRRQYRESPYLNLHIGTMYHARQVCRITRFPSHIALGPDREYFHFFFHKSLVNSTLRPSMPTVPGSADFLPLRLATAAIKVTCAIPQCCQAFASALGLCKLPSGSRYAKTAR